MENTKERMALLYHLKTKLLENFYVSQTEKRNKELTRIATHNRQMLRTSTPTFMFEGKWYADFYPFNPNPLHAKEYNRVLHDSLREQVYQLVHHDDFEDLEDRAQVSNLVGNALTESKVKWDIDQLLPEDFTQGFYLTINEHDIFNIGVAQSMTPEEVQHFKEQNAEGYKCLGRLRLTKLLLPDP